MKTAINLIVVLVLALSAFARPTAASAGGGLGLKFKGPSTIANFYNASGCLVTEAFIVASVYESKDQQGPSASNSFASVTVRQFDVCADTLVLYAYGTTNPLSEGDLVISNKLDSAHLQTIVPVFDEISGVTIDLAVDLSWTGTGPLSRQNTTTHFQTPGCRTNSHFHSRTRLAQAWGIISGGGTNFTPDLSSSASLNLVKNGTVIIGCS